ncbi:hypothetical protein [uncultured Cohaesibacter sp.]|nr:hypothetical protein [uncultured Cohaesibacter sp.]
MRFITRFRRKERHVPYYRRVPCNLPLYLMKDIGLEPRPVWSPVSLHLLR